MKNYVKISLAVLLVCLIFCGSPLFSNINKDLVNATMIGDLDTVIYLINKGADVNVTDSLGKSPIHYASRLAIPEMVEVLIGAGADPNMEDRQGKVPLHYAVLLADDIESEKVVKLLIDNDALNYLSDINNELPLHIAASRGLSLTCEHLYKCKTPTGNIKLVNEETIQGQTPLHYAALYGHKKVIRMLLQEDSNPYKRNNDGMLPYDLATNESVKRLLSIFEYENIYSLDETRTSLKNEELLLEGIVNGYEKRVEELLKTNREFKINETDPNDVFIDLKFKMKDYETNAMHYSALYDNRAITELLVTSGVPYDLQDKFGYTPLHYAAENGFYDIVEYLLSLTRINIGRKTNQGDTALHLAVLSDNIEMVKLILEKSKVNINLRNNIGWTALHNAYRTGNQELINLLLSFGARDDIRNLDGLIPSEIKSRVRDNLENSDELENIEEDDFNLDDIEIGGPGTSSHGHSWRDSINNGIEQYLGKSEEGTWTDKEGRTLLHIYARDGGNLDEIISLIKSVSNINAVENSGKTPLHYATIYGRSGIVSALLEHGADINAVDNDGKTPLHYASHYGNYEMIKLLIESGADTTIKDREGKTPAESTDDPEVANYINSLI